MESIEVADQGHVPLLEGDDLIRRIAEFVDRCDAAAGRAGKEKNGAGSIDTRQLASPRGDRWR
jgi:hypothetical protein